METAKERRAPCADCEQAAKKNDGVDAFASRARPVGAGFEVEPQGEFVEGESRADAVADRHKAAEEDRQFGVLLSQVEQPAITDQQKNQNAPHQVMDVVATDHDPAKGAFLGDDGADEKADTDECKEKRDRSNEHATAWPVGDGGADEEAQPGELEQDEQDDDDQAGKGQQQQSSSTGHTLLKHFVEDFPRRNSTG